MAELGSLALGYGAGALSTSSPCVLPLLPIILLGAQAQHAWGVGGLVLTGLDKIVEAALTRAMPDWLVAVTTRL